MGEIAIGDTLFDECGTPCRVVAATPVMFNRPCFRVVFSDGQSVVADAEHQWLTADRHERAQMTRRTEEFRARRRGNRPSRAKAVSRKPWVSAKVTELNKERAYEYLEPSVGSVRTTTEIARTITAERRGGCNHSVAVAAAIECAEIDVTIDPYVLGLWLGDGHTNQAALTTADGEIVEAVASAGYAITKRTAQYAYGLPGGFVGELRRLGVLGNKHIPAAYLRGSEAQRLALLQGLMDTDGYCDKRGQCEFTTTKEVLADGVVELLASLGIKVVSRRGWAKLNGKIISPKWGMKFLTEKPVFRLSRKLIRQKRGGFRGTHSRRYITAVESVESVPVRCIEVDSPSHLFLAGRAMIPTHNSHLMRCAAIIWCATIPGLQVYLFRRLFPDLVKNHMEGPKGFRSLLAPWVASGHVTIVEDEIRFWNGSKLYLCHCKDEKDRFKYQGAEIHVLLVDELTHFPEVIYRFLRTRVRAVGLVVPANYGGAFPRVLASSNPGNIGHAWVKLAFVDRGGYAIERMPDEEGGMLRQYIPSRLEDNPSMATDDPQYRARLRGAGSAALVKALEEGDWNVIEGAFFDKWSTERHVVEPFDIPGHWALGRSFDWGYSHPFSVGWWTIASEPTPLSNGLILPRGGLARIGEWYGASSPDVGLRLQAEDIAKGIKEREALPSISGRRIALSVGDRAIWAEAGASHGFKGQSIGEKMAIAGVPFQPSDSRRRQGWDQVRGRLDGDDDGNPMLVVVNTCKDFIRTVPVLQHDQLKPEDLDTDSEDHAADDGRYFCMARPWAKPTPKEDVPIKGVEAVTLDRLFDEQERELQ